jgi:hypothetical protein
MSLLHVLPGYSAYLMATEPSLRNLINATVPSVMAGYALRASVVWFEAENVRRYGHGARYGARQMAAMKAHEIQLVGRRLRTAAPRAARGAPFALAGALAVDTMVQAERGNYEATLPGLLLNPFISYWLSDLGANDTRGGSESALFYNP